MIQSSRWHLKRILAHLQNCCWRSGSAISEQIRESIFRLNFPQIAWIKSSISESTRPDNNSWELQTNQEPPPPPFLNKMAEYPNHLQREGQGLIGAVWGVISTQVGLRSYLSEAFSPECDEGTGNRVPESSRKPPLHRFFSAALTLWLSLESKWPVFCHLGRCNELCFRAVPGIEGNLSQLAEGFGWSDLVVGNKAKWKTHVPNPGWILGAPCASCVTAQAQVSTLWAQNT